MSKVGALQKQAEKVLEHRHWLWTEYDCSKGDRDIIQVTECKGTPVGPNFLFFFKKGLCWIQSYSIWILRKARTSHLC